MPTQAVENHDIATRLQNAHEARVMRCQNLYNSLPDCAKKLVDKHRDAIVAYGRHTNGCEANALITFILNLKQMLDEQWGVYSQSATKGEIGNHMKGSGW